MSAGPAAEREQGRLVEPEAVAARDALRTWLRRGALRLVRHHDQSPPTVRPTPLQTGPFGNEYSSSDSGSISML